MVISVAMILSGFDLAFAPNAKNPKLNIKAKANKKKKICMLMMTHCGNAYSLMTLAAVDHSNGMSGMSPVFDVNPGMT